MNDKITILDIASHANVSPSTVSRVLNHPGIVKEHTRVAVMKAIDALNYIPPAPKKTDLEKKAIIGLAIPNIKLPMIGEVIREIDLQLEQTEYDLLLINMKEERSVSKFFLEHSNYRKKIDGIIIFSANMDNKSVNFFRTLHIPIVLLQNRCAQVKSICTNNYLGAFDAVQFLIDRGYKKIAFIGWEPEDDHLSDRFYGYKNAIDKAGLQFDEEMAAFANLSVDGGYTSTRDLCEKAKPEAIFYACDTMAFGGYKYFSEAGLSIPQDLGIVGFDDYDMASILGLTTMKQFISEKAKMAVSYILDRLSGTIKNPKAEEVCITPKLIIRRSTL